MTEEDIATLFEQASALGYRYKIPLLGDECIVAAKGYSEGDFRISDSEHIIHELTHCVLLGVSFDGPPGELISRRLTEAMSALSLQDQCMNEIEVFSVVMEVMRRKRIEFDEQDYLCQLPIQLDGFKAPNGFNVNRHARTFWMLDAGQSAVRAIMRMLESSA